LKADQTIYVQAANVTGGYGLGIKGKVLDLSGSTLRLRVDGQPREFSERDVLVVSERHRYTGTGALIGLGAGAALEGWAIAHYCGRSYSDGCSMTKGLWFFPVGLFAAIGAMGGAQTEHERVLFLNHDLRQSPAFTLTPFVDSSRRGLAASLRF
jgi:hypothetical protein